MKHLLLAASLVLASAALPAAAQPPMYIVFFPDWSGAVDHAALSVIQHAADQAKQNPSVHITVTGYADNSGSVPANIYLTQLRAQRVIDAMEADGVPASQMELVAKGRQEQAGVASRRVEIQFGS